MQLFLHIGLHNTVVHKENLPTTDWPCKPSKHPQTDPAPTTLRRLNSSSSPPKRRRPYIQVLCYQPLRQLHSDFGDFNNGFFFHGRKIATAESNTAPPQKKKKKLPYSQVLAKPMRWPMRMSVVPNWSRWRVTMFNNHRQRLS